MKLLLICTALFFILLYIDTKTYSNKYDEKTIRRMEKEDELLKYLEKKYNSIVSNMVDEAIKSIESLNINNEELLREKLQETIFNNFSEILIREESDDMMKELDDGIINLYVSICLIPVDFSSILDYINIKKYNEYRHNNKDFNINIATEAVSDTVATDDKYIDITDNLNSIFFGE